MWFIIFILISIIIILSFYLILLKKEIRRTATNLKNIENEDSNVLLNKEFNDKNLNELLIQINLLLKSINEKVREINLKNNSLKKMITNVAHDLRTPLTSAMGYMDMIKNGQLTDEEKEKYTAIVEERLSRLSYLITNFFDFSKVILNNKKIEFKKENIVEILERSIVNYYDDFNKDGRRINLDVINYKIELITNELMLMRVFENLIINAYKHSKSDLSIKIQTIKNKVRIEFINELEDKSLDVVQMFDEFYTEDISRTKENTGLGLAIVKEFVQTLNGIIYAQKDSNLLNIVIEL